MSDDRDTNTPTADDTAQCAERLLEWADVHAKKRVLAADLRAAAIRLIMLDHALAEARADNERLQERLDRVHQLHLFLGMTLDKTRSRLWCTTLSHNSSVELPADLKPWEAPDE